MVPLQLGSEKYLKRVEGVIMSIFSALFGKKEESKAKITIAEVKTEISAQNPSLHLKGKPDANGLYPSELVMLFTAERYKTTETNFPGYLMHTYEIANPAKMLKKLQSKGFIEVGTAKGALDNFKLTELKEMASALGFFTSPAHI